MNQDREREERGGERRGEDARELLWQDMYRYRDGRRDMGICRFSEMVVIFM